LDASETATTRTEEIRRTLADDIVQGRLSPGTALEEIELARIFGVSRTPVREAIRQLEAEGFARARPRRGAVVASIAPERLLEMFQVMGELEAVCARESALAMTQAERRGLEEIHRACAAAVRGGDLEAYYAANESFHDALYTGSHNGFLAETTLGVRRRVAPFRRAQFFSLGRLAKSYEEHERIVQAILRADGPAAETAARGHIIKVERTYQELPRKAVDQDRVPDQAAAAAR